MYERYLVKIIATFKILIWFDEISLYATKNIDSTNTINITLYINELWMYLQNIVCRNYLYNSGLSE